MTHNTTTASTVQAFNTFARDGGLSFEEIATILDVLDLGSLGGLISEAANCPDVCTRLNTLRRAGLTPPAAALAMGHIVGRSLAWPDG